MALVRMPDAFAPAAASTCEQRLENPHIGNCGVPFMNRTTRWFLTMSSMR